MELSIWIAFLAGLVSFLSPCVLSLMPVYLTYLTGRAIMPTAGEEKAKQTQRLFLHGVSFVLGFSLVFITLGLAASALGNLLYDSKGWIAKIGGIIIIFFGLHVSGILTIPFLNYELKPQNNVEEKRGFITSFLMGVFFSAGWSPCIGPVLGAILVLAVNNGSLSNGLLMLTAYSMGMAIPFLISTLLADGLGNLIRRYKRITIVMEKVFGVLMIVIGFLLFFGIFEKLAKYSSFINFGI